MAKRKAKPKRPARKPRQHAGSPAAQKRAFLAAFAVTGIISRAAAASGVPRQRHPEWMKDDQEYAAMFAEAQEIAIEQLEIEARRRAMEGVGRLKFYQGQLIMVELRDAAGQVVIDAETKQPVMVPYVEHEYSDQLLMFMLRAARPDVYRERRETLHSGNVKIENSGTIRVVEDKDWYGNANRLASAGDGASATDHLIPGSIQGAGVRAPLGQNGNGNGKSH